MATSLLDQAMEFDNVKSGGGSPLDPGQYLVKLIGFERVEDGQFGPRRCWVFNVADPKSRTPIYDQNGQPYEFRQNTSTKMGKKARAREWFEALLDRELADGEPGIEVARAALNRQALAMIGPNDNQWVEIIRMMPLRAQQGRGAAANTPTDGGANPFDA